MTACVFASHDVLAQNSGAQRRLKGQRTVSPLDQYRRLMQLQHATQQANVDELKKMLGLNDQQLKKLSEVFNKPGGVYQSNLPLDIKKLALEHPEVIEHAIEIQQQLQRLQQNRPDVAPTERSSAPKAPSTDEPIGVPGESEAQQPQGDRRLNATRLQPDAQRSLSSSPQQPAPNPTEAAEPLRRSLPDGFEDLLEHAPGASREEPESKVSDREIRGNTDSSEAQPDKAQKSSLPSNLSRVLEKQGVRRALKHLVQNARKETVLSDSTGAAENTNSSTSIWNRTIASAVDFVRDDVVEFVDERRRQQTQNSSTNNSRFRPPSQRQRQNNSASQQSEQPTAKSNSSAVPEPPPLSLDDALPQLPNDISAESMFPFLLVVGLVIAVLLLAGRHRSLRQSSQTHFRHVPVKPGDIRSREDIVRAFHWLTEATTPEFAEWWHHRRALETMVEYTPERKDAIRELAELYEVARYDRNDESFDDTRLQQARDALAGCLA